MIVDLAQPIAVVCHDAGAANLILAWLAVERPAVRPVMAGPSAALWQTRFPGTETLALEEALDGAASVLSGTGWASDLEHLARQAAIARGLPSVAVIDHWVNYLPRFERGGTVCLPDAIWVTDGHALAIACSNFSVPVIEKPNFYLEEQAGLIGFPPASGDVLYIGEPIRTPWREGAPSEFEALDYFMVKRGAAGIAAGVPIRIRLHPSEPPGKYDEWIASQTAAAVSVDGSDDLATAIRGAGWVVGCQSYGLVVAQAAGRRAICALPPWAPAFVLPQPGILCLRDCE